MKQHYYILTWKDCKSRRLCWSTGVHARDVHELGDGDKVRDPRSDQPRRGRVVVRECRRVWERHSSAAVRVAGVRASHQCAGVWLRLLSTKHDGTVRSVAQDAILPLHFLLTGNALAGVCCNVLSMLRQLWNDVYVLFKLSFNFNISGTM